MNWKEYGELRYMSIDPKIIDARFGTELKRGANMPKPPTGYTSWYRWGKAVDPFSKSLIAVRDSYYGKDSHGKFWGLVNALRYHKHPVFMDAYTAMQAEKKIRKYTARSIAMREFCMVSRWSR